MWWEDHRRGGETRERVFNLLNLLLMPTSKFRVSFTPTILGDAVPSTQELVLDLGGTGGATEGCPTAERPGSNAGEARASRKRPCSEYALDAAQDPATSTGRGSFHSDQRTGYDLQWPDIDAFEEWRRSEERAHTIELRVAKVEHGAGTLGRTLWTTKHVYRCARQRVGQKADQITHPERQRKTPRKGTGCRCQIVIKRYPHTPVVLGRYVTEHNHDLGANNLPYMRLSDGARQQIMSLLIQKVDTREIVRFLIHDQGHQIFIYKNSSGSFARQPLTAVATNSLTLEILVVPPAFWMQKPSACTLKMLYR